MQQSLDEKNGRQYHQDIHMMVIEVQIQECCMIARLICGRGAQSSEENEKVD